MKKLVTSFQWIPPFLMNCPCLNQEGMGLFLSVIIGQIGGPTNQIPFHQSKGWGWMPEQILRIKVYLEILAIHVFKQICLQIFHEINLVLKPYMPG